MSHRPREMWHTMKVAEVEKRLKTNQETGLGHKVCRTRLERFGRNELFLPEPRSVKSCARRILTDPSLLVLVFVCLIALCFARFATALAILFVLAVSCTVSIVAYVKTNRIKETMSSYSAPRVRVVRGGQVLLCEASSVVPGDVLLLGKGDVVPCDARLVSSSDFCVLTYVCDKNGAVSYAMTRKEAAEVYDASATVPPLKRINMVYAGSVVHRGSARAIVTETGEHTYIAMQAGSNALAMQVGDPSYLTPMRKYMNRYCLIMCALVLPVTLIGILAAKGQTDLLDVLLLALSLVVSCMSEQLVSMGRVICACAVIRASLNVNEKNAAIIKNYRAIDSLSCVDELFLFGRTAISDGKLHPYAVYTADALFIGQKMKTPTVAYLYEMVYFYEHCAESAEYRHQFEDNAAWRSSVRELGDMLGFDRASADIRTVFLKPLEASSAWVEVSLRRGANVADRHFRVHRCLEPEPLLQCNARCIDGKVVSLDGAQCQTLFDIFCQLKNQGTEVCAYIREEGGLTIFEGLLSFREAYAPEIPGALRQLEENHVRVSLFLPEEGKYHLNYLLASGWIDSGKDAVSASRLYAAGKTLADVFDKKRVFFGFPDEAIEEQIKKCRAEGKVTASLGLRHGESPLMTPADICLSCEMRTYRSSASEQAPQELTDMLSVEECDQSVRRNADVLIRRAGTEGGGLAGIYHAILTARSIHYRMMLAMQYLLVAQLLRMTVVILPLLFGTLMVSPTLLLVSGVWIDLAYVLICAFHHCDPEMLREVPDYRRFFKSPLRSRPDWLCATLICGAFTVLTAWILSGTNTLPSGQGLELYTFLSLFATQTCLLFCLLRTTGNFSGHWRSYASSLVILGAVLMLLAPIFLIPPIARVFCAGGLSIFLLVCALLAPLYLVGGYFLCQTYRRKLVRRLRVYFRGIRRWIVKLRRSRAYTDGRKDAAPGQASKQNKK